MSSSYKLVDLTKFSMSDSFPLVKEHPTDPKKNIVECIHCIGANGQRKRFQSDNRHRHWNDIHVQGPKFVCKVCDKHFAQWSNYKTHANTHSGNQPHICDLPHVKDKSRLCGKSFRDPSQRTKHQRDYHKVAKGTMASKPRENTGRWNAEKAETMAREYPLTEFLVPQAGPSRVQQGHIMSGSSLTDATPTAPRDPSPPLSTPTLTYASGSTTSSALITSASLPSAASTVPNSPLYPAHYSPGPSASHRQTSRRVVSSTSRRRTPPSYDYQGARERRVEARLPSFSTLFGETCEVNTMERYREAQALRIRPLFVPWRQ